MKESNNQRHNSLECFRIHEAHDLKSSLTIKQDKWKKAYPNSHDVVEYQRKRENLKGRGVKEMVIRLRADFMIAIEAKRQWENVKNI